MEALVFKFSITTEAVEKGNNFKLFVYRIIQIIWASIHHPCLPEILII